MRELNFRAWDKTCNEMHNNVQFGKVFGFYSFGDLLQDQTRWMLMQYTGLRDKNGREIYEGDIVLHVGPFHKKDEGPELAKVIWKDAGFSFWGLTQPRGYQESYCPSSALYCEVIGNIYENPELLEGDGGRK